MPKLTIGDGGCDGRLSALQGILHRHARATLPAVDTDPSVLTTPLEGMPAVSCLLLLFARGLDCSAARSAGDTNTIVDVHCASLRADDWGRGSTAGYMPAPSFGPPPRPDPSPSFGSCGSASGGVGARGAQRLTRLLPVFCGAQVLAPPPLTLRQPSLHCRFVEPPLFLPARVRARGLGGVPLIRSLSPVRHELMHLVGVLCATQTVNSSGAALSTPSPPLRPSSSIHNPPAPPVRCARPIARWRRAVVDKRAACVP